MKWLNFFILLSIAFVSFSQTKSKTIMVYEAVTRGSSMQIKLIGNQVYYTDNVSNKEINISNNEIEIIEKELSSIKLSKLHKLKAPSSKSHTDAALQATLTITYKSKSYQSAIFDHGNPPIEIKKLIDLLFKYTE